MMRNKVELLSGVSKRWPSAFLAVALAMSMGSSYAAELIPATAGFVPGEIWRDTAGQPINAHGGGVLFHEGVYYWYGELKEGRTYVPAANYSWGGTRVVAGGVSCYSSTNLTDWKNEGIVLPSVPDDPNHDLHCDKVIERRVLASP
jgi:beta-galactosidase